ncbi:uncharacterized protein LMH87_007711 [Akanthomyces muscarius]|uniref:Uncharacterized protein n=1 Tax=Akanthomyces muscarius TaxID=2231603 RepID=A0A9W8QJN3_AKAMU|nr:uncharacterized protein LMH87_007711 [Akanthomyces muscarius]KAJ4161687.1 hypothetical protein LMH87_007711 [Akanthomyces muscarius]
MDEKARRPQKGTRTLKSCDLLQRQRSTYSGSLWRCHTRSPNGNEVTPGIELPHTYNAARQHLLHNASSPTLEPVSGRTDNHYELPVMTKTTANKKLASLPFSGDEFDLAVGARLVHDLDTGIKVAIRVAIPA